MNTVGYVALTEKVIPCEVKDSFELRRDRGWIVVQTFCLWVLKKIGAYSISNTVHIERHSIDGRDFMERLYNQMDNFEHFFNKRPRELLIGATDFRELMGEREIATQVFKLQGEYRYRMERHGIDIKVIPWMKGMVVMPD